MTRVLFAKTKFGYPILAIGGFTDSIQNDVDMNGDSAYDVGLNVQVINSEPSGIYLWEGEYPWGGEMGPEIKTRSIRSANLADITELGMRSLCLEI
jgi:hypothetical protein